MLFGNNTGVIYSPGFPNNYPDRMDCLWTITAPDYKYLLLNFTELQLETGGCSDRVEVRDGRYSWNKQLESYCASQYRPQVLVPSGRWARVKFSSDTAKNARGFLLFIRFTDNYYETTAAPYTVWPTTPYYCKWSLAPIGAESSRITMKSVTIRPIRVLLLAPMLMPVGTQSTKFPECEVEGPSKDTERPATRHVGRFRTFRKPKN